MTNDEQGNEGTEEAIEDLEAPAAAQRDVLGGGCIAPSCLTADTGLAGICIDPTCRATQAMCGNATKAVIIYGR